MSFVHCSSCHRAYDLRRSAGCPSCRQKAEAAAIAAAKAEAERAAAEAARLEAARLEAARVEAELAAAEAARLEAARVEAELAAAEAARLEAARVEAELAAAEAARLEAAKVEAAQVEAAKVEAARLADEAELVEDVAAEAAEVGPRGSRQASAAGDELTAYRAAPREDRIVAMVEELAALLESASTGELEAAQRKLQQRGLRAPWTAQLTSGGRFLLAAGSQLVTQAIRAPQQGARKLARRLRAAWSGNGHRDDLRDDLRA